MTYNWQLCGSVDRAPS